MNDVLSVYICHPQIAQLQVVAVDTHKEKLRQENQELRLEVDRLKTCLLSHEKAQGITQVRYTSL